jgi:serine/threonine-protein kinase
LRLANGKKEVQSEAGVSLPDNPRAAGVVEHERSSGVQDIAPVVAEFGKYHLLAVLGRGGMGDVYLAMVRGPLDFKKLVVIKKLREAIADDERILTMFLDEGRVAARLNHPHLVQTHEIGEVDGAHYIAMEYLEGQPIARIEREVPAGELDPRIACRIVSDALAGLEYAHELRDYDGAPINFVHRDLSPQNIFVTYQGVVKIVDFGIAKTALGSSSRTEAGMLKGKLSYIAPEQVVGDNVDRRADIFSMGVVLWELVARRRLIQGKSAAATLNNLVSKPIPRLSSVVPSVDPQLDDILARALEKDADARYATAREMRDELERYLASSGPPVLHEQLGAFVSKQFRERREKMERQIQACMAAIRAGSVSRIPAATSISRVSNVSSLAAVSLRRDTPSQASISTMPPPADADDAPTLPRFRGRWHAVATHYGWWGAVAVGILLGAGLYKITSIASDAARSPATIAPAAQAPAASPVPAAAVPAADPAPHPGVASEPAPKTEERPATTGAKKSDSKSTTSRPASVREAPREVRAPVEPRPAPTASASRDETFPAPTIAAPSAAPAPVPAPEAPAATTPARRKFRTEF